MNNGHSHDHPHDVPGNERDTIEFVHTMLMHNIEDLERSDTVYLVIVDGINVWARPEPVAAIRRADLVSTLNFFKAMVIPENKNVEGHYLFAYTTPARQVADEIRDLAQQEGWTIVFADRTGCRTATRPLQDSSAGTFTHDQEHGPFSPAASTSTTSPLWLALSVRNQRLGDLQIARAHFGQEPAAHLPSVWAERVYEALGDHRVHTTCLLWQDQGAIGLWQHLAARAPAPLDTLAQIFLAGALYQRNQRREAFAALERAHAGVARRVPEGTIAQIDHADDAARTEPLLQQLLLMVGEFILSDFDSHQIHQALKAAIAQHDAGEQAHPMTEN